MIDNPFRLLRSERIQSDAQFLRLFGAGLLPGLMECHEAASKGPLLIIQSTPGGGKTSLLRLLTPSVLMNLHQHKTNSEYRDLYELLRKKMSAFSSRAPRLLGVHVPIDTIYAEIQRLSATENERMSLFRDLLDIRIGLSTLVGIATLTGLEFPDNLDKIKVQKYGEKKGSSYGNDIYVNLSNYERRILAEIDSMRTPPSGDMATHSFCPALNSFEPKRVRVDGKKPYDKMILMLDDMHALETTQLRYLLTELLRKNHTTEIWVTLRSEAMRDAGIVLSGAREKRDYINLYIEDYWRGYPAKFRNMLEIIADKRVRDVRRIQISSFRACVDVDMSSGSLLPKIKEAEMQIRESIVDCIGSEEIAQQVIQEYGDSQSNAYDRVVELRAVKIMIDRKARGAQTTLVPPEEPSDFIEKAVDSNVRSAARIFLAQEMNIPCYFGFDVLARLGSFNVEQFLSISGSIFKELLAKVSIGESAQISADRQQTIIEEQSEFRWASILQTTAHGFGVQGLIEGIGTFCSKQTFQATSPYAPGVTGVALDNREFDWIMNLGNERREGWEEELADVLKACLIDNLLEKRGIRQGKPTRPRVVLYLNRLLCVRWALPLQYGGWRRVRARDLHIWMLEGYDKRTRGPRM